MIFPECRKDPSCGHVDLLCKMKQGKIQDYGQTEKKTNYAQRHVPNGKSTAYDRKAGQKHKKSMVCTYVNQNACNFSKNSQNKKCLIQTHFFHMFECWSFLHLNLDCRQKQKSTKMSHTRVH